MTDQGGTAKGNRRNRYRSKDGPSSPLFPLPVPLQARDSPRGSPCSTCSPHPNEDGPQLKLKISLNICGQRRRVPATAQFRGGRSSGAWSRVRSVVLGPTILN